MNIDFLNEEDVKFLKGLAERLKTQNTRSTAQPVLYHIAEPVIAWGIDQEFDHDRSVIVFKDNPEDTVDPEDIDAMIEWAEEYCEGNDMEVPEICDMDDFTDFLEEQDIGYYICYGREDVKYHNAFLTEEAAEKHLSANNYHYNHEGKPYTYCSHGWRNPELERLLEIVKKFGDNE